MGWGFREKQKKIDSKETLQQFQNAAIVLTVFHH
jgi:hypothetical protein